MYFPVALLRRPRTPRAMVRQRLLDATDDALAVVIAAPAGTGKTVLASQLADRHGGRVAWIRLAPGYDTAADVVALVAASLRVDGPAAGASIVEHVSGLVELLEEGDVATVLVIDDYHHALSTDVDRLLAETMALLPDNALIVVSSRNRPVGLAGRLAGVPTRVIDVAELAFTPTEVGELAVQVGRASVDVAATVRATRGWPAAVAVVLEAGDRPPESAVTDLIRGVLFEQLPVTLQPMIEALAVLPYLTPGIAQQLGIGGAAELDALTEVTLLVTASDGGWRLDETAADLVRAGLAEDRLAELRGQGGAVLAARDPGAAIDLFLAAGSANEAADVLAGHLSEVGVDRAVRWLYQLPAELRHRFPPVLAAGQATVNLGEAMADAQRRLDAARDDVERREALFALGSARAHAGELSAAATALEAAGGPGAPARLAEASALWLGVVRWWAGDLVGAAAGMRDAGGSSFASWVRSEIAMAEGDLDAARSEAEAAIATAARTAADGDEPRNDASESDASAAALGVLARVAWRAGDIDRARELAADAYSRASAQRGFILAAAAPAHVWMLVHDGRFDEALGISRSIDASVGRFDEFSRLHAVIVELAVARARSDPTAIERAERKVARRRALGFAAIEREAAALLWGAGTSAGLELDLLGPLAIRIDGAALDTSWRSRKALDVLVYVALAGDDGARRESVIEAIWPEREPDKGRRLLRTALSDIRTALEPNRPAGEPSSYVFADRERVRVAATTDVDRARRLAAESPAAALALFRGDLYPEEVYADWAVEARRDVVARQLEWAERVADDDAASAADRLAALAVVVERQPWDDRRWEQLEQLHLTNGDAAGASAVARRRAEA